MEEDKKQDKLNDDDDDEEVIEEQIPLEKLNELLLAACKENNVEDVELYLG